MLFWYLVRWLVVLKLKPPGGFNVVAEHWVSVITLAVDSVFLLHGSSVNSYFIFSGMETSPKTVTPGCV